jgi:hypothetical protein
MAILVILPCRHMEVRFSAALLRGCAHVLTIVPLQCLDNPGSPGTPGTPPSPNLLRSFSSLNKFDTVQPCAPLYMRQRLSHGRITSPCQLHCLPFGLWAVSRPTMAVNRSNDSGSCMPKGSESGGSHLWSEKHLQVTGHWLCAE